MASQPKSHLPEIDGLSRRSHWLSLNTAGCLKHRGVTVGAFRRFMSLGGVKRIRGVKMCWVSVFFLVKFGGEPTYPMTYRLHPFPFSKVRYLDPKNIPIKKNPSPQEVWLDVRFQVIQSPVSWTWHRQVTNLQPSQGGAPYQLPIDFVTTPFITGKGPPCMFFIFWKNACLILGFLYIDY